MVVRLGTFAAGFTRALRDQAVVDGSLPAQTRYLKVDGARGWLYPIRSELGDAYELFAYFDGSAYQVKVVSPDVEDGLSPHECHVFPDGRICLGDVAGGGMPSLEEAYARSVVWCNGFSVYVKTGRFPF
jgi:hypothetical protein